MSVMRLRDLIPGLAVGSLVGLAAQGYYAGHRTLPSFGNLDPSGSFGGPGGTPVRIVALGDSTMTGPGLLDPAEIWVRQSLDRFGDDVHIQLHSVAVGGAKARDVRRHQLAPALALEPDIALVSVGSNDAIRAVPLRLFRAELALVTGALADAGAHVVVLGIGDLTTIPRLPAPLSLLLNLRGAAFDRMHRKVAAGHPRVVKVPMREIATHAFRTRPGMFAPDLFHPSRDGHAAWADAAHPTIVRLIHHVVEERTCGE